VTFWVDKIGRITPAGAITEFPIPAEFNGPPLKITAGPDGNLWFTTPTKIERISPTGVVTEFPIHFLGPPPDLSGITAGPDGNVWFTESTGNKIGRITPPHVPGDLNGDGDADLVWRDRLTGDVAVWLLNGAMITQEPLVAPDVPLAWQIAGVGDFNGDGNADLIWRQTQTGDVAAWLMNGAEVMQSTLFSLGAPPLLSAGVPLAWRIAGIGDVDGDGKSDLVWRHTQTGDVAVWLMNGATVTQSPVVAPGVPLAWQIVGVGDLNGDGTADLIWRHTQTGDVAVWLMDGATVKQSEVVAPGVPLTWQIQ